MSGRRIHILGASGSGTTTLGRALADHFEIQHFDTDDFYWKPTRVQFTEKRTPTQRLELIDRATVNHKEWSLSGSFCPWGDPLIPQLTHVVFLSSPASVREQRLRAREIERYGNTVLNTNTEQARVSTQFLEWAMRYDTAGLEQRSLATHMDWIDRLPERIRIIQADGSSSPEQVAQECLVQLTP